MYAVDPAACVITVAAVPGTFKGPDFIQETPTGLELTSDIVTKSTNGVSYNASIELTVNEYSYVVRTEISYEFDVVNECDNPSFDALPNTVSLAFEYPVKDPILH